MYSFRMSFDFIMMNVISYILLIFFDSFISKEEYI